MRYLNLFVLFLTALCFVSCENASKNATEETGEDSVVTCEGVKDSLQMVLSNMEDGDCLVYWTSDTVCANYSGLVLLLDTLYQHVRSDEYSENAKIEEQWMNSYRKRICNYYDRHNKGQKSKSEFEKAELVLKEGTRLVESNCDYSTMEMVVKNSIEITFARLSEYGLLTQMISKCKDDETKNLVYKEWEQLENIRQEMIGIVDGLVHLSYWTGSGGIPIRTERWLDFSDARKRMYQNLIKLEEGGFLDSQDYFKDDAVQYLTNHLKEAVKVVYSDWEADQSDGSPLMDKSEWKEYQKVAKEIEKEINTIQPKLKEWITLWSKLESKLTHKDNQNMPQVASKMLVEWANITPCMEEHRFSE